MKQFQWGILATGVAARKFAHGLRAVGGASVAVVASRNRERAEAFANDFGIPRACGSYQEAVEADGVDAFYIATPPSGHRDEAIRVLRAGKPVLIEKPFAVSFGQAREIIEEAHQHKLFCMEAMWTRFIPLVIRVKELIDQGEIGEVRMLAGSFGVAEAFSPDNPLYNAELGGGALLDRGVYPISMAHYLLGVPDVVQSDAVIGRSNVDEQISVLLRYPTGAQAMLYATLRTQAPNDFRIMGSTGTIHMHAPMYRPHRMTITRFHERPRRVSGGSRFERFKESGAMHALYQQAGGILPRLLSRGARTQGYRYVGNGYHYEAEEVMRCVRSKQLESTVMPLSQSLDVMETVERVRRQWSGQGAEAVRPGTSTDQGPMD